MGLAYLPDGTRMDYKEYIDHHPHWQVVRQARFRFDEKRCAVCHCSLEGQRFETHHLVYTHCGNERMTEVITLCPAHHKIFHNNWARQVFHKGKDSAHWETYSIEDTAQMCLAYYKEDKFISKDESAPNLCNKDIVRIYIDQYIKDFEITHNPIIDPFDFTLFVRNKRYEMFFEAESRGLSVEQFLDECYGPKVRGKNPLRAEAGKKNGPFDHTPESFHMHYAENPNLNKLMELVKEKEIKQ